VRSYLPAPTKHEAPLRRSRLSRHNPWPDSFRTRPGSRWRTSKYAVALGDKVVANDTTDSVGHYHFQVDGPAEADVTLLAQRDGFQTEKRLHKVGESRLQFQDGDEATVTRCPPFSFCVLTCLLVSNPLWAQQPMLRGEVVLVDEYGKTTPAARVEVTVKETGGSDIADGKGLFRVTLPQAFGPGRAITVGVDKQGWAIWEPLEGKTPVPQALLTIRLLRKGSKKFWTDKFIETFIEDTAEKAKLQVELSNPQEKPKPVDFGQ
jgi:hypothetical protein